jgi:hypothetical protein
MKGRCLALLPVPLGIVVSSRPSAREALAARAAAKAAARRATNGTLYHYTAAGPSEIAAEGLTPSASGKVLTRPRVDVNPQQAQIDLLLRPNRESRRHLVDTAVAALCKMEIGWHEDDG